MSTSPTDEYRALMEQVKSPNAVHEDILSEIARVRRAEQRRNHSPHARHESSERQRRRWQLPFALVAAACACALAVALVPLSSGSSGLFARKAPHVPQNFSVLAYASDTRTLVPPTEDGMIVFDRSGSLTTAAKEWYLRYGKYTGCMFTVQGEDIVRIQATTSIGMFYRNSYETVNERDDPERVAELRLWKPTKAGLGEYYGLYEDISIIDGFGAHDPDKNITVQLTKMLGSTIDLPISPQDDSDAKSFGLWTNADYGEVPNGDADPIAITDAVFDTFEGQTITVTAYFEDGSCATQTIELHAADFKATMDNSRAISGYGDITIYPEIVDRSTLPDVFSLEVKRGEPFALHSLYGVIVDEAAEPHPYPLDNANEWLNKTVPFVFERADEFTRIEGATIDESSISDPSGKVTCNRPDNAVAISSDTEARAVELSNLRMERSAQLPFGLAVKDTIEYSSFQGDMAYANRVSEQRSGYRIEDDGSLTPGFSYRIVTFDATNPNDEELPLLASALGLFAVRNDDGTYSIIHSRAMWTTEFDPTPNAQPYVVLAPHETRELTVVYIVSDKLDELNDPLLVFSSFKTVDENGVNHNVAFRISSLL